ncbi:hypothetical protein FB45DRAFT_1843 [Roridomyces roridus]|uniref:Protein kinase domain-containing protein n=1 Tax=Roridomyces roridus TaxID=1738132 RepID=A0AAD7CKA8_9AGAR|nr:hypothetical protein FB45DRAFT_1843 [Roridomyces roridus]
MSFISNASGFTLGEGTYNNVQGNINNAQRDINKVRGNINNAQRDIHNVKGNIVNIQGQGVDVALLVSALLGEKQRQREDSPDVEEPAQKKRRVKPEEEEEDGPEVIRRKDLNLIEEIGSGPGYFLHTGRHKERAVIVKVFISCSSAREHLEATVALSEGLWHPNVLRIHGTSSSTSPYQFIAYEDASCKNAEKPLAEALKESLVYPSVVLGFKLIAGLSSGINYLSLVHGISLSLGAEDLNVFFDRNDRFLLGINPPPVNADPVHERDDTRSDWTLFNKLCQKVFRLANRLLHDEDIERTATVFDSSPRPPALSQLPPMPSLDQTIIDTHNEEAIPAPRDVATPVPPRREYVWRTMNVPQSLASIATQIARDLDLRRAAINRLVRSDGRSIHRCPGYIREEVTLATRTADSAVVSHDSPTVQEVCSVCREVVNSGEVFRCACGQKEPGLRPTVKCRSCKTWSHRDCGPTSNESICYFCFLSTSDIPLRAEELFGHEQDGELATETSDFSFAADPRADMEALFQDNTNGMPEAAATSTRSRPSSGIGQRSTTTSWT